jgi:hypothetical protein
MVYYVISGCRQDDDDVIVLSTFASSKSAKKEKLRLEKENRLRYDIVREFRKIDYGINYSQCEKLDDCNNILKRNNIDGPFIVDLLDFPEHIKRTIYSYCRYYNLDYYQTYKETNITEIELKN